MKKTDATTAVAPRLLSLEEVAERLGTPHRFARRLIEERRITFVKVGRYVRVSEPDLAEFIANGRIEPGAWRHR